MPFLFGPVWLTVARTLGIVTTANSEKQLTQSVQGRDRSDRTRLPSRAFHHTASKQHAVEQATVALWREDAVVFLPSFSSPRDRDPKWPLARLSEIAACVKASQLPGKCISDQHGAATRAKTPRPSHGELVTGTYTRPGVQGHEARLVHAHPSAPGLGSLHG